MDNNSDILEVGALVNLGNFLPQMEEMSNVARATTEGMSGSFQELASTTSSSTTAMGGSWLKLDDEVKVATTDIAAHLSKVGAKISETAERSRLGVGTMEASFSGLSTLLGAGIAVGFAAHFLDETTRVLIELDHLSTTTRISVETLSGLRAVAQQTAVPFESIQVALARMQRAQVAAIEGHLQQIQAFKDLGISVAELKTLAPEELFYRIASGISAAAAPQIAMNSGMIIMGRGVQTLIPLLEEYGGNLKEVTEAAARNSGVTEESVRAAREWHQETAILSQQFQAAMIPALQAIVKWAPIAGNAVAILFDVIKGTLLDVTTVLAEFGVQIHDIATGHFEQMVEHVRSYTTEMVRINRDMVNSVTGDLHNLEAAVDRVSNKSPVKSWSDQAKDMLSSLKQPLDLSGLETPPPKDMVAKFREELDEKRDAETGFRELSKAEEAAFWQSKLAIARSSPAAYRAVYHEMVAAERAARNQSLTEEVSEVEDRVAAERVGSTERVTILQEELDHLKSIGADKTAEYRRIEQQLTTAEREAASARERAFADEVAKEISMTKSATDRMMILRRAMLQAELNGFSLEGEAFKKLKEEEINAERQYAEQRTAIQAIDDDAEKAHQQSLLDMKRSAIAEDYSMGLISNSQRLAMERQVIQQEIALERQALQAKQALYANDPVAYEKVQKQLLALTDKYDKLMADADAQARRTRMAGWVTFDNQLASDFSRTITQLITTNQRFSTTMMQLWGSIINSFVSMLAQMIAKWAAHQLVRVALATAAEAHLTTATAAGNATRAGIEITADTASVVRSSGVAAAAAFASVMEAVPFPYNVAAAPAVAAAALAETLGFGAPAMAEKGALLDRDMPIFAHANEMILPSALSTGMQKMINAQSGSSGSAGGGSDNPFNFHYHAGSVNALDRTGFEEVISRHPKELTKFVQSAVKRGAINPRRFMR
jgi:hypothetical protein